MKFHDLLTFNLIGQQNEERIWTRILQLGNNGDWLLQCSYVTNSLTNTRSWGLNLLPNEHRLEIWFFLKGVSKGHDFRCTIISLDHTGRNLLPKLTRNVCKSCSWKVGRLGSNSLVRNISKDVPSLKGITPSWPQLGQPSVTILIS